jgi:predicted ATPase
MGAVQLSSVICPTLIGRAEQVALLTELMTLAGQGQSRLALIAGEAGVGKSRQVAEIKVSASQRGVRICNIFTKTNSNSTPLRSVATL